MIVVYNRLGLPELCVCYSASYRLLYMYNNVTCLFVVLALRIHVYKHGCLALICAFAVYVTFAMCYVMVYGAFAECYFCFYNIWNICHVCFTL